MTTVRARLAGPWQYQAAVLAAAHAAIVVLYATGLAISSVPFTHSGVHSVVASPLVPGFHLVAAVALASGVLWRRVRDIASVCSFSVWAPYTAALTLSALLRTPHLALVGPVMAASLAAFALGLVLCWGHDDERP